MLACTRKELEDSTEVEVVESLGLHDAVEGVGRCSQGHGASRGARALIGKEEVLLHEPCSESAGVAPGGGGGVHDSGARIVDLRGPAPGGGGVHDLDNLLHFFDNVPSLIKEGILDQQAETIGGVILGQVGLVG